MAVAFGLVTLVYPMVGAMVIISLVPVVSGLAQGYPVPNFRLYEVIIGGLGPLVLLTRQRRVPIRWGHFEWCFLLYCAATAILGAVDLIMRDASFGIRDVGSLFGPFQLLIVYLVVASVVVDDRWRRTVLRVLLFASVPVGILAILQEFNLLGVRQLLQTATGVTYFQFAANLPGSEGVARATGPFSGWQDLGGYLAIIILLGMWQLLDVRCRVLRKRWLLPVLAVAVVAIIQTATITTIGIAFVGTLVLARAYGQLGRTLARLLPALVIAGVAFLPLFLKRVANEFTSSYGGQGSLVPNTLQFRWETWTHQWIPLLHGHWLTGYGPDLPSGIGWQWPDSLYLQLTLRGGIPLVLIQLGLMLAWGLKASSVMSVGDPLRMGLGRITMIFLFFLVIADTIVPYFVDAGLPYVLAIVAGLSFGGTASSAAPSSVARTTRSVSLGRPSPVSNR